MCIWWQNSSISTEDTTLFSEEFLKGIMRSKNNITPCLIPLVFTYICVSLHHSKVQCTWVRVTYFINPLYRRHRDLSIMKATFFWIMMTCISVLWKGMWKVRVQVLVVWVFICLIFTIIISLRYPKHRCILLLMCDVKT